jgi:hypothetical protein
MKKEGFSIMNGIFVLALVLASIAIISAQTNAATPTQCFSTNLSCGMPITTTGRGAVELCQTCFTCGSYDGVCPEDFSDGTVEDDYNKTRLLLRAGIDRPQIAQPAANPLIFRTGIQACTSINGTCTSMERKTRIEDSWTSLALGLTCATDVTANTDYIRAVCSAPKTAGCQYCPDPDCTTEIRGITYDMITNESLVAKVNIVSTTNWNFRAQATSDSQGLFTLQAPRGNVRVICTAEDYTAYEKDIFLQKGNNVVDCKMDEAACSDQCTLPNINGVPICSAKCDLQNGCQYNTTQTKDVCSGVPLGGIVTINRTNSTHVLGVTCCEGSMEQIYRPIVDINANNIPNLLTRDYRKLLNGVPVTLRIITYTKD